MQNPGGKRLAILVNEFGEVGVDGEILRGCADGVPGREHRGTCQRLHLLHRRRRLHPDDRGADGAAPRPDHILIETSGLALPKPLLKAFDWPAIRSRITVDGVIALADAEAVAAGRFAPTRGGGGASGWPTRASTTKRRCPRCSRTRSPAPTSSCSRSPTSPGRLGIARAKAVIAAEAPRPIPVIEVAEGAIDPRVILGLGAAAEDDLHSRPSHHDGADDHEHEDFDSVVIDIPELADPQEIVAAHRDARGQQNILRVKGYAAVAGKPMRLLVQAVGARVRHQYDRPWAPGEARRGRLVVIAEHDDIDEGAIRGILVPAAAAAE
jgi:cobalamin biosynthesis protein CobW